MEIFKLFGSIFVDSDKANNSISKTEKKTEGLGSKLGNVIATAGKVGMAIGGAAVAGSAALGGLIGKTLEATGEINKFADVTGMSRKGFQQWDSVMKTFGYSAEQASGDLAALAERAMDAASGAGENAEMFKELGVSVMDSNGHLKSQEQLFNETIAGLQGMEDVTRRNAIATAMLSTTGEELAPILNMSNEELQKMKNNAKVISDDDLDKAEQFRLKWEESKQTFSNLVVQLGIAVMPMLTILFQWVGKVKDIVVQWVSENQPKLNAIRGTFMDVLGKIINIAKIMWGLFKENVLPIFVSLYKWIQGHMPTIRATTEVVFSKIVEVASMVWAFFKNNILPILSRLYEFIQSKMPAIQSIIESVFGIIANVVKTAWDIFENLLLPVLKALWDFISPIFPVIQTIVEDTFSAIIKIVEDTVGVFKTVTGAIQKAVDWLTFWDNKDPKPKTVKVNEQYSSGSTPRYAVGTNYHPGGPAIVGEEGPELLHLPKGSKVRTANETRDLLGKGMEVNVTNYFNNVSSPSEIKRKEEQMWREKGLEWGLV